MRDFRGNEITRRGTKIVYPVRYGSRVTMRYGVVQSLGCSCGANDVYDACLGNRANLHVKNPKGRIVTLTNFTNVVVVK